MLTPSEERRHRVQLRRRHVLNVDIAAFEKYLEGKHPGLYLAEREKLLDLRYERDKLEFALPRGDVSTLWGDPTSLTYDREPAITKISLSAPENGEIDNDPSR